MSGLTCRFHNEEEIDSFISEQLPTLKEISKRDATEKKEIDTGTIMVMNFISSFSALERTSNQNTNKHMLFMNKTITQHSLTDIY